MADPAAVTCVNAHVWPGHYNMLEVPVAERQKALDLEAMALMNKPRWEPSVHLVDRFNPELSSAEIGTLVAKFYYRTSGYAAKVFGSGRPINHCPSELITKFGVVLLRRPPANNRDEGVTRDQYEEGMATNGYSATARSPTILLPAAESESWCEGEPCMWVYGGCTCAEAWYGAKMKYSDRACINVTCVHGIQGCVLLWDWTDPVVLSWMVVEQNRWQSGSGYNIQQFMADVTDYSAAWAQHCRDLKLDYKSWGKGPTAPLLRSSACVDFVVLIALLVRWSCYPNFY